MDTDLYRSAQEVLLKNRVGTFTKPAPQLYPYQWNWDSGFISMAYSHINMKYAYEELNSLFSAQWQNGLLPQIVFHQKSDDYFPGPDFWQAQTSGMCSKVESSGITMPAVHGFVLLYLLSNSTDLEETKRFLKVIVPKVQSLHSYLYQNRDPNNEGLPYIRHPWEGGTDNSPLYDNCLAAIDIDQMDLPDYKRKDLIFEGASDHRPLKKDYDRYVYLVDLFRRCNYNELEIDSKCPFRIQDPLFIGILNYSNQALIEICDFLNLDKSKTQEYYDATNDSLMNKLWDGNGLFNAFDLNANKKIIKECNSCLIPALTASFSVEEMQHVINRYENTFVKEDYYSCVSYSFKADDYESSRYWRGPIWLNLNYLIYKTFERLGFRNQSEQLVNDSLDLIRKFGYFEYFEADKSKRINGCGTNDFSWSAAMCIVFQALTHK